MATAPRPGAARNAADETRRFRITMDGRTLEFPTTITLKEKMAVRLHTQLPFEAYFPEALDKTHKMGADSLAILWWLGRRHCGEPNLPWSTVEAEWPDPLPADLKVEVVEDDGEPTDDPEGSGAG